MTMHETRIASTNINTIGYDGAALFIRFNHGGVYRYDGVPAHTHAALLEAESAGKFFHAEIKGKFEFVKLDKDPFILPI